MVSFNTPGEIENMTGVEFTSNFVRTKTNQIVEKGKAMVFDSSDNTYAKAGAGASGKFAVKVRTDKATTAPGAEVAKQRPGLCVTMTAGAGIGAHSFVKSDANGDPIEWANGVDAVGLAFGEYVANLGKGDGTTTTPQSGFGFGPKGTTGSPTVDDVLRDAVAGDIVVIEFIAPGGYA